MQISENKIFDYLIDSQEVIGFFEVKGYLA